MKNETASCWDSKEDMDRFIDGIVGSAPKVEEHKEPQRYFFCCEECNVKVYYTDTERDGATIQAENEGWNVRYQYNEGGHIVYIYCVCPDCETD